MENNPIPPTPVAQPEENKLQVTSDEKNMAVLAHAGGILFGFLPSLIIWLVKKDESAFVATQAKEALNFQIFIAICFVVSSILIIVLIGVLLIFLVWLLSIIFCIIAAVKTANGEAYRYPITWRLIK